MGLFSRSKITSDEYSDLSAKIVKLNSDVLMLKASMESVEERVKSFHGRLTKRIKDKSIEQEEGEEGEKEEMSPADIQRALMGLK